MPIFVTSIDSLGVSGRCKSPGPYATFDKFKDFRSWALREFYGIASVDAVYYDINNHYINSYIHFDGPAQIVLRCRTDKQVYHTSLKHQIEYVFNLDYKRDFKWWEFICCKY